MNRVQLRRQARGTALQVLYELDCTTHEVSTVLDVRLDEAPLDEETEQGIQMDKEAEEATTGIS